MNKRLPLVASFLLFILLCASAAYWAMQLFKPPLRPVAAPPRAAQPEIRPQAAATLFGARGPAAVASSNYQLHGVIFSGSARDSIAIVSADGKPAQAFRVGAEIVPGVEVKEVHRGYVILAEGGATKRIELPDDSPQQASITVNPALPPVQRTPIPVPSLPAPATPTRAQAAASGGQVPAIGPQGGAAPPGTPSRPGVVAPPPQESQQQAPMGGSTAPPPNMGFVPPQSPATEGLSAPPPPMAAPPGANPAPTGTQ